MTFAWSTTRPVSAGKVGAADRRRADDGGQQRRQQRRAEASARDDRAQRDQNFTFGAACASSVAVNSAIGLLPLKKVEAQITPGKVRNSTL